MTAAILKWTRHHRITSDRYEGISGCSVCTAWEGEMPTDCPGVEMTEQQRWAVLEGKLDYFRKEGWSTFTRSQRLRVRMLCE